MENKSVNQIVYSRASEAITAGVEAMFNDLQLEEAECGRLRFIFMKAYRKKLFEGLKERKKS
jgi:hypothetical protein